MADSTGLEAVTSTLRSVLLQRMQVPPDVTVARPDLEVPNVVPPVLNLFLYRVSENASLKNQDLPGMAPPASLGRPPLSLDLHYLLMATGQSPTDDRGAQRVLGDAMVTLHDHPIIPKDDPLLDPALREEVELVNVTFEPLTLEDLSKIWTATSSPFRLAVGYLVTVVQLESTLPRRIAKPVLEPPTGGPRIRALPMDRPVIAFLSVLRRRPDTTERDEQAVPYVRIGEELVVNGSHLDAGARVLFDDVDVTAPLMAESTSSRRLVGIPDDPRLQPGVRRLELVRDVTVGDQPDEHTAPFLRSNVASFVLVPTIETLEPSSGPDGTVVTITGLRLAMEDRRSMVLVGDRAFPLASDANPTEVQVIVSGLQTGIHGVSVRVNGAESIDSVTFEVT